MAAVEIAPVSHAGARVGKNKAAPPAREKKPGAPKPSAAPAMAEKKKTKTSSAPSHPPYFEMIKEAIMALKERTGSSPYAIAKFIEVKHHAALPANYKKILSIQLKNFTAKGRLIKVKASFKLSDSGKKFAIKNSAAKGEKPETKKKAAAGTKHKTPSAVAVKKKTAAATVSTKRKAPSTAAAAPKKKAKKAALPPAKPKSIKKKLWLKVR